VVDVDSRVAVIGASGFIGGATLRRLTAGGVDATGYTRQAPAVRADESLAEGLAGADMIFWLASSIRPARSEAASQDYTALAKLLDGLHAVGSKARLLAISSGGTVYDPAVPPPYSEQSPVRAANDYGQAMLAVEALLAERWDNHVIVRASNAYGPGQPARRGQGVVAHWLDSVHREEPIRVMGDPEVRRDYIYIDDLVEAIVLAASRPEVPPVLNVGSGVPTSLAELVQAVRSAVGFDVEVEQTPARSFDAPSTWLDVSLARDVLGWQPSTDLTAGVASTWRQLRRRRATDQRR